MSNASPFTQLWKQSEQKREAEIERAKLEIIEKEPPPPTPTPTSTPTPISPERNFTKVANSIKPEIFRGTSQKTYMALYRLTRGAIVPKRIVKITRNDLMAFADVSEVTLVKHLTYLEKIAGLIKKTSVRGDNEGSNYEIFVPEEVPTPTPTPTPTSIQKLGGPSIQKVGVGVGGNSIENKDTYENSKTSLKTKSKNDDDYARVSEAFSVLAQRLDAAAEKITGKGVSKSEAEKWGTLADLLILELEVAASRADGVSSVPAFLTEVLRRQFFSARQQQTTSSAKSAKTKIDAVGKTESGVYEIKPLDEKGREAAIEQLREFAGENFLDDFEKWYTPDDWRWLKGNLKGK
jgi:hypothetical protein